MAGQSPGLCDADVAIVQGRGSIYRVQRVSSVNRTVYQIGEVLPNGEIAGMGPGARFAGEVQAGDAGRYGDLIGRVGDEITPHHMPQAAQGFTPYRDGGALALPFDEHVLTRTYGWRGAQVLEQETGLPFRQVLARDFRDIRSLFGSKYNEGMRDLYRYYQENYPQLMQKPPTPGGQP